MLYRERDLNKPKVAVLHQRLQEANPFSEINCLERKISDQNILKIAQGADLLLADLNELQTAAVLNRAAIKIKIPLIIGLDPGNARLYHHSESRPGTMPGLHLFARADQPV